MNQQDDWSGLLSVAEFVYNNETQLFIECSLFYTLCEYHSEMNFFIRDDKHEKEVSAATERIKHLYDICKVLVKWWQNIVNLQAKYYDKKHIPQTYKMRDLVMLLIKNLQLKKSSWNLSHKFIRPFRVKDLVEKQTYRLFLSDTYWIHNVFHVFYLKLYQCCWEDESISSLQLLKLINNKEEYEIEKILNKWKHKKKIWYKIKWKNWSEEYNQWVQEWDMTEVQNMHRTFNESKKHWQKT